MKKKLLRRMIAVMMVFSMLPVNASAVEINGWNSRKSSGGWLQGIIQALLDRITDDGQKPNDEQPDGNGGDLTLVTDSTTVENGDMLRASTYELTTAQVTDATTATLKYFPVTLYNYETDVINAATHESELASGAALTQWEGIYFSDGAPAAESYRQVTPVSHTDLTWAQVQNGTYYADTNCTTKAEVKAVTRDGSESYSEATVAVHALISADSRNWKACTGYYYKSGSNYYPLYAKRTTSNYYYNYTWGYRVGTSTNQIGSTQSVFYYYATSTEPNITVYTQNTSAVITGYTLTAGNRTLANLSGTDTTKKVDVTLYTVGSSTTSSSLSYADWNWWDKGSGNTSNGQKFYTGLAQSSLDANKNIVFTKPDGGIFNSDRTVKNIYTNVEMPFVYQDGYYTFDAAENGVYFHEDTAQGSSGTAASNSRLYFNAGTTQSNGGTYGDGSTTVWAPFNDSTSFTESNMVYHFGMRATVPFTMTANGRISANDDTSKPVTFSFSGDDDVWVFIDGKLVIDLGGIHNRLDATIDFAANTVTYSESNTLTTATGSYNDSTFKLTQTLFSTDTETGLISQNRASFAASASHELTIFYLERGRGSSNCKIEFNLPMNDSLTVTKKATRSYSKQDGEELYTPLTTKEQAVVDNIDFGFTLYRSYDGVNFETVSNLNYSLLNSNGQVVSIPSTDANGRFTLRNGQSARFVGDMGSTGVWYYVVEDSVADKGFVTPDYSFGGEAAGGFDADNVHYTKGADIPVCVVDVDAAENKSTVVKVTGSDESADTFTVLCENFLDAELPNPSIFPVEDRIVLDYGLDVEIDALANDTYRGESIELISVSGDGMAVDPDTGTETAPGSVLRYGTATVVDGKIVYSLNQQLTGVEVLNYVAKVTGNSTGEDGVEYVANMYAVGKIYVIPATIMYYEENFEGMVTFTGAGWQEALVSEPQYTVQFQEPGVVGTVDDSPYGSDVAYQHDSHDSNGTSKYASTENGSVKFEYTFTGTGTSFFARTSNNTGYMKVTLTNADGDVVDNFYRDTYYETADSSTVLYNIPVVTFDKLPYGTYKVTVLVAKKTMASNGTTVRFHSDFWLDGIRVFNPMDTSAESNAANKAVALAAYAADGEANMANVTLRNKLLKDDDITGLDENGNPVWKDGSNFVLFTDTDGAMQTAEQYQSIGPKEEVYLNDGQSVTFALSGWDPNTNKIYLGMKAPKGNAAVKVGNTTLTLDNAADCYFDISSYAAITEKAGEGNEKIKIATFTIKAGAGDLVSLTNIKVTGNAEFTIINERDVIVGGGSGGTQSAEEG